MREVVLCGSTSDYRRTVCVQHTFYVLLNKAVFKQVIGISSYRVSTRSILWVERLKK